jgi:hypothetical protein
MPSISDIKTESVDKALDHGKPLGISCQALKFEN